MNTFAEYLTALALIVLLALLVNPTGLFMPTPVAMGVILVAALLAVLYGGFVLKEGNGDERDMLHRMFAGRAAFLAALTVLTVALLVQGFTHMIDPWIPAALGATIFAKLIARVWASRHQ